MSVFDGLARGGLFLCESPLLGCGTCVCRYFGHSWLVGGRRSATKPRTSVCRNVLSTPETRGSQCEFSRLSLYLFVSLLVPLHSIPRYIFFVSSPWYANSPAQTPPRTEHEICPVVHLVRFLLWDSTRTYCPSTVSKVLGLVLWVVYFTVPVPVIVGSWDVNRISSSRSSGRTDLSLVTPRGHLPSHHPLGHQDRPESSPSRVPQITSVFTFSFLSRYFSLFSFLCLVSLPFVVTSSVFFFLCLTRELCLVPLCRISVDVTSR